MAPHDESRRSRRSHWHQGDTRRIAAPSSHPATSSRVQRPHRELVEPRNALARWEGLTRFNGAWHDLLGVEDTILDEASDPVVRDAELRGGFRHRERSVVLFGGAVGVDAMHGAQ